MRISPAFAGLVLAGCALGADPAPMLQPDTMTVPDIAPLAPRIQNTFNEAKLTGSPRVSSVRKAPVSALGDWAVCLRSDAPGDPRVYALFIQNNEIVDFRLALIVDGCANVSFDPLPSPPPPIKAPPMSKR